MFRFRFLKGLQTRLVHECTEKDKLQLKECTTRENNSPFCKKKQIVLYKVFFLYVSLKEDMDMILCILICCYYSLLPFPEKLIQCNMFLSVPIINLIIE